MNPFQQLIDCRPASAIHITPRQKTIIAAYNDGDDYRAIAERHGISVRTVEAHIRVVVQVTKANNTRHACAILRRKGIL